MRVLLANDTINEDHLGCRYTSIGNRNLLEGHDIIPVNLKYRRGDKDQAMKQVVPRTKFTESLLPQMADKACEYIYEKKAEAVVINAEGSFSGNRRADLLAWAVAGKKMGVKTIMVNGVYEGLPEWYAPYLAELDDVVAREPLSQQFMESIGVPCRVQFDSILAGGVVCDPEQLYKDKIVVTDGWGTLVNAEMKELCDQKGYEWMPLRDDWRPGYRYNPLAGAKLCITGRFHGAVLSLMAGVPFMAVPSNTHKIKGLCFMIDRPHWHYDSVKQMVREDYFRVVMEQKTPNLDRFLPLDTMRGQK